MVRCYRHNAACRLLIKSLMAMSLLPLSSIVTAFQRVKSDCHELVEKDRKLLRMLHLIDLFESHWIIGTWWQPKDYCLFEKSHRIYNVSEQYLLGLRQRIFKPKMSVYPLLGKLWSEAENVNSPVGPFTRGRKVRGFSKPSHFDSMLDREWYSLKHSLTTEKDFFSAITGIPYIREDSFYAKYEARINLQY